MLPLGPGRAVCRGCGWTGGCGRGAPRFPGTSCGRAGESPAARLACMHGSVLRTAHGRGPARLPRGRVTTPGRRCCAPRTTPPPPWVLLALQASPSQRVTLGRFEDKQVRGAVHAVFKAWPSLATETAADNAIVLGLGGGKGIKRRRSDWAGGAARYLKFTLSKENMESQVGRGGGGCPGGRACTPARRGWRACRAAPPPDPPSTATLSLSWIPAL